MTDYDKCLGAGLAKNVIQIILGSIFLSSWFIFMEGKLGKPMNMFTFQLDAMKGRVQ